MGGGWIFILTNWGREAMSCSIQNAYNDNVAAIFEAKLQYQSLSIILVCAGWHDFVRNVS